MLNERMTVIIIIPGRKINKMSETKLDRPIVSFVREPSHGIIVVKCMDVLV